MKAWLKQKHAGLSVIEVALVLAISAGIFVIVIGTFSARRRTAYDDSARQVVSQIQTVVNEAQSGKGPTIATTDPLYPKNNETLFGEAIEFKQANCSGVANKSCMIVYKLKQQANNGPIVWYEKYQEDLTQNLRFYIPLATPPACNTLTSCYQPPNGAMNTLQSDPLLFCGPFANCDLIVVIRNGSGAMYAFSKSTFAAADSTSFMGPFANNINSYQSKFQGKLQLGLALPLNNGATQADFTNATFQYYINMGLGNLKTVEMQVVR